jgi:hypothetical protein
MIVYMQVVRAALWPPLKYIAMYAEVDHASTVPLNVSRDTLRTNMINIKTFVSGNMRDVFGVTQEEFYLFSTIYFGGTRWYSWLRHCATTRKVAGSISDGVIGIFHWQNSSGHTEMSTRNISWGKGGRCVGLTTLQHSCVDCLEIWDP